MFAVESSLSPRSRLALLLCTNLGACVSHGEEEGLLSFFRFNSVCDRWAASTGTGEDVLLKASESSLRAVFPQPMAERILYLRKERRLSDALHELALEGITVLCPAEDDFPDALQQEKKLPFLFVQGERALLRSPRMAAVVGTRSAGEDALAFARDLGKHCGENHITVVSGGAAGVDSEVLCAALNGDGAGVFMLPCGLQHRDAKRWLERLGGHYLLASPFLPHSPFSAANAALRNRLIYLLSQIAVVVSAHEGRGGSWRGAVEALGRDESRVFVRYSDEAGNVALHEKGAVWLYEPKIAQML